MISRDPPFEVPWQPLGQPLAAIFTIGKMITALGTRNLDKCALFIGTYPSASAENPFHGDHPRA